MLELSETDVHDKWQIFHQMTLRTSRPVEEVIIRSHKAIPLYYRKMFRTLAMSFQKKRITHRKYLLFRSAIHLFHSIHNIKHSIATNGSGWLRLIVNGIAVQMNKALEGSQTQALYTQLKVYWWRLEIYAQSGWNGENEKMKKKTVRRYKNETHRKCYRPQTSIIGLVSCALLNHWGCLAQPQRGGALGCTRFDWPCAG